MAYILDRTRLGFCWWDVIALIILVLVIVTFSVKINKMNEEKKQLEKQLADLHE